MIEKANYTQTYWCSKGKYPELNEAIEKLIPAGGPVANAKKNRALEKFRKASNCYYDLYNNGLCNRAAEFRRVFGFGGHYGMGGLTQTIVDRTEAEMDRIILSAALEPQVLADLVRAKVDELRDDTLYAEKTEQEFRENTQLVKVSDNWSDVAEFVQDK